MTSLNKKIFTILISTLLSLHTLISYTIIDVYPREEKQSTGIYVRKGDKLQFEVNGTWKLWDKYNAATGEGHQFIVNELGNWGALLAQVGDSTPFLVGNKKEITSNYEGVLYLFPNKGKYKIENSTGSLEVGIEGGIPLDVMLNDLSKKGKKVTLKPNDGFLATEIYVQKGTKLKIYAFGAWTMWDEVYPKVSASGHEIKVDEISWGRLFGGIGSTYGQYLESFPVGEKTSFTASNSGILSFYPYTGNYVSNSSGTIDIYIIGGDEATKIQKVKSDEAVRAITESLVIAKINEQRRASSLSPIETHAVFASTAPNHAKYMISNNSFERTESEHNPEFTGTTLDDRLKKLGFEGRARELFCQTDSALNAVELFFNTVYHRLRLLDPNLKYLGYGSYKSSKKTMHVFDLGYSDENIDNWEKILYPPNNATNVKTSWSGIENPDPLPVGTIKPMGSPVSIMFKDKLKEVVKSEIENNEGEKVACFIITPYTDLNNKNINSVILIPKEILKNQTKYTVNIEVILEKNKKAKYSWSFITE